MNDVWFDADSIDTKHLDDVETPDGIMSEAEYNNLMENLYVRSDKVDYKRLLKPIEQLKNSKCKARKLVDDE